LRRLVRGVLVVAAGTAALSLAGPFALRPFADVAGAAGTVSVAFVLDFGGSPAALVTGCVTVPDSATRYDALSAFVASKGLAPQMYDQNGSGLLCSINGVPTSGCGQIVPGGYIYWAYFTGGSGGWSYSNTGAFGTVTPNDVEGWRFEDPGSGRPNDHGPRSPAAYRRHCPTTPPTTTTKTTKSPAAATAATTGTGTAHPHTTAPVGSGGSAGPAAISKASKAAKSESLVGSGSVSGAGRVAAPGGSGSSGASGAYPAVSIPPDPEVGVVAAHHVTPGGGPDPLIVGGILAAGLAVAAWARWRRRPRTP
jgi:hypothetical protein